MVPRITYALRFRASNCSPPGTCSLIGSSFWNAQLGCAAPRTRHFPARPSLSDCARWRAGLGHGPCKCWGRAGAEAKPVPRTPQDTEAPRVIRRACRRRSGAVAWLARGAGLPPGTVCRGIPRARTGRLHCKAQRRGIPCTRLPQVASRCSAGHVRITQHRFVQRLSGAAVCWPSRPARPAVGVCPDLLKDGVPP
jgi:hypothetical protein